MKRRLVYLALVLLAIGLLAWLTSTQVSVDNLSLRERQLREIIANHPVSSWVIGFFAYWIISLVPGTRGKAVVWGWLFGFLAGSVMVNCALTAAAVTAFLVSRHLLYDVIQERYGAHMVRLNRALERNGAMYVILMRVVPVSFSVTNYVLGTTNIRTMTFWWSTQLGLLPGNLVFVYVGSRLPSLSKVAHEGVMAFFTWDIVAALVVLSICPLLLQQLVKWLTSRRHAVSHGGAQH